MHTSKREPPPMAATWPARAALARHWHEGQRLSETRYICSPITAARDELDEFIRLFFQGDAQPTVEWRAARVGLLIDLYKTACAAVTAHDGVVDFDLDHSTY